MQKIMFNDDLGLTAMVLCKLKPITRREPIYYDGDIETCIIDGKLHIYKDNGNANNKELLHTSRYALGEVVAVAQSYESLASGKCLDKMMDGSLSLKKEYCGAAWNNKMFVRAEDMPKRILMQNIRCERLQAITDQDCMLEGVVNVDRHYIVGSYGSMGYLKLFDNPRDAFRYIICKTSKDKEIWDKNPYVVVYQYSFEF